MINNISEISGDGQAFERLVASHRRDLRALCYRMTGSMNDADDLVQESLLRAWRGLEGFDGRSSTRTWLHTIAVRVCLNALAERPGRALPMQLAAAPEAREDAGWIEPCPPSLYRGSPESSAIARESVSLALMVSLQRLPARQRAALILKDVLGYRAAECAEILEMSVAAVNSALQRARATLARAPRAAAAPGQAPAALLRRYIDAWERADVAAFVALLAEDATLEMPPLPICIRGAAAIGASVGGMVLRPEDAGRFRCVGAEANGLPAVASYQRSADGVYRLHSLHLLVVGGERIAAVVAFMDPALFAAFELPEALPDTPPGTSSAT